MKILMNNCGSQAVEIINLLHKDSDLYIVYLSSAEHKGIMEVADEFYVENIDEEFNIEKYKDFLIDFCISNSIEVFIPFKKMEELSYYKNDFESVNIKVMLPSNTELFRILNDKRETYKLFESKYSDLIPLYKVFNNETKYGIFEYLDYLRKIDKIPCIKYVTDIASNSFRVVRSGYRTLNELEVKSNKEKAILTNSITDNDLYYMISHSTLFKDIMVMEYLDGNEISCDCLKTKNGNIIIPRIKAAKYIQSIERDENLISLCNQILDDIDYDTPCNIQFKDSSNGLKLLEINTRMSGGVMFASQATGINIPLLSVKQLCGEEIEFDKNWPAMKMIKRIEFEKK